MGRCLQISPRRPVHQPQARDLLDDAESLALRWASEANLFVCQAVLKDGVDGVKRKKLSGNYYEGSVPVLAYLVRHAGLRLAGWINEMVKEERLEQISAKQKELR